jgi:protease-4
MWTGTYDYDEQEYARFQAGLDRIYEDFTSKVAAGRDLPLERVLQIARGRIWTGEDAKALGLVDELGGMDVALRLAREAAGLDADAPVRLKRFPPKRSPVEMLFDQGRDSSGAGAFMHATTRMLHSLQPKVRWLQRLGLTADAGVLTMPETLQPN